jgi:RND family efflux transporter MFP subunit
VEIQVGIPETDIHLLKTGLPARISLPALPGESFDGIVTVINVASDPATRTYMTRISVPNPTHILKLGMVAETVIQLDEKINAMVLPGETVIRDPQGATFVFVYYPDQKRVYAKRVSVGSFHHQQVEIKEGLSGDELVVIAGQDKLREGDPAAISDASASESK